MADKVIPGEDGTAKAAVPAVPKERVPGIDNGKIWIAKDFNVLSERELDDWYAAGPPLSR